MKAKSIGGGSTEEIRKALLQSLSDGFKPKLAILFLSVKQDRGAICKILDDEGIAIYGATTNGEFTDDGITAGGAAMMLLDMDPQYFCVFF